MIDAALQSFAAHYAEHRASEGRGYDALILRELPYLKHGPLAAQWAVRARSFETLMTRVVRPAAERAGAPLTILDLGAGNGWLSYRLALEGHRAIAIDIRDDVVDGLGAAKPLQALLDGRMECVVAAFDSIPVETATADISLFNASLHYATDLRATLEEAARVTRPGGQIVIVDSPFYASETDGLAMVNEKKRLGEQRFGERAGALLAFPCIEFLTRRRLAETNPGLEWRRFRVRYPLSYELRPLRAALAGKRSPSRFDIWAARRP